MLLASALLSVTITATPAAAKPRAWSQAETILHVPSLQTARPLFGWFEQAGRRAVLLRPTSWRDEFHPLFLLDPTSTESLAKHGISPASAMTLSSDPRTRVACLEVADAQVFQQRADAALTQMGALETAKKQRTQTALARREGKIVAGYALVGTEACAFRAPAGSRSLHDEVAALAARAPKADARFAKLEGAAFLWTREGTVGLDAEQRTLRLDAVTKNLPAAAMLGAGASPYGPSKGDSLLHLRTRLPAKSAGMMVDALEQTLREVCRGCDRKVLAKAAATMAPLLTGQALAHASRVQVKDSLRTPSARYAAVRHALLAETSQPKKAAAAIATLANEKGASVTREGLTLAFSGGQLRLGVRGNQVYVANDEDALRSAFASVLAKEQLAHGTVFRLDPKALARGLSQISFLDAMGGGRDAKLLGGLFAFSTEGGPLLSASESIEGGIDPHTGGGHRVKVRWTLDPG